MENRKHAIKYVNITALYSITAQYDNNIKINGSNGKRSPLFLSPVNINGINMLIILHTFSIISGTNLANSFEIQLCTIKPSKNTSKI